MRKTINYLLIMQLFSCCGTALADYKEDIGYTRLLVEQGTNTPSGDGLLVTQVEAVTGNPPDYMPDVTDGEFTGKLITDMSGTSPAGTFSAHATSVGRLFYGTSSSIAPELSPVKVYKASTWLSRDYLQVTNSGSQPDVVSDRIANHSWVEDLNLPYTVAVEAVKRIDWVVANDEYIQVAGLRNDTSTNSPLLSSAFNVIAVGTTGGVHGRGTAALDAPYVSGRTRPDLVAPFSNTSSSTPVIAAASALLVNTAHVTASLSTDPAETSTKNRAGTIIYNAERSEVVKAVLMAGADRVTNNTTNPDPNTPKDITDYRVDPANQSANGLDVRFGAGQVNIYNSFHILTAGEQDSIEDVGVAGGHIGSYGFDYDPSFGSAGNNVTGSYYFSTGANPVMLTAALVWNVDVEDSRNNSIPGDVKLYDLDLRLYDKTAGGQVLVAESASLIENTENIWIQLGAGKDYLLEVVPKAGQASFDWDYALAWQMMTLNDGDEIPAGSNSQDENPVPVSTSSDGGSGGGGGGSGCTMNTTTTPDSVDPVWPLLLLLSIGYVWWHTPDRVHALHQGVGVPGTGQQLFDTRLDDPDVEARAETALLAAEVQFMPGYFCEIRCRTVVQSKQRMPQLPA